MLESGKPERQLVLTLIYRMDDKDFNAYFLHHIFTGDIHAAPTTLATFNRSAQVRVQRAGRHRVPAYYSADESVKVVRVDSVLPCDKDYSIRMRPKSAK